MICWICSKLSYFLLFKCPYVFCFLICLFYPEDLSNLVNKVTASGRENRMASVSGSGVVTKPKRIKRISVTIAQVHDPVDGNVRDLDFVTPTSERKQSRHMWLT